MKTPAPLCTAKIALVSGRSNWLSHLRLLMRDSGEHTILLEPVQLSGGDAHDHHSDAAIVDADWLGSQNAEVVAAAKAMLENLPFLVVVDGESSHTSMPIIARAQEILPFDVITPALLRCSLKLLVQNARLEFEIGKQNKRYHSLFYNSVDPAFFLDDEWNMVQVNEAFSQTFGERIEALKGQPFTTIFQDISDFEQIKRKFTDLNRTNVDEEAMFSYLDRKGRFLGHIKISVLQELSQKGENSEAVRHFHGFLSNISYRERLRNIKERADRVDMTYRLARTLAHEIRNPLTNIHLALEHMKDESPDTEAPTRMWSIINRASQRINELINQLLTSSERSHLQIENCELSALLTEVAQAYQDRAGMVNAQITTDFEVTGIHYPCDVQKIKLAISNLVSNAIEALSENDGLITIGTYAEAGYYVIYVEDNGAGMTEEVKKGLFDPFFTSKEGGVGLGLTAAQTIIAEHEGEIEVESEWGHGSTFTISLPLRNEDELALPSK